MTTNLNEHQARIARAIENAATAMADRAARMQEYAEAIKNDPSFMARMGDQYAAVPGVQQTVREVRMIGRAADTDTIENAVYAAVVAAQRAA